MSEELCYLDKKRKSLVEFLSGAPLSAASSFASLDDGGMGSFRVCDPLIKQELQKPSAEARYTDADGVTVSISLYCDIEGRPASVDFWKHDFAALIEFPTSNQIEKVL